MENYVVGNGTVYEYEIPLCSFSSISASAKYGENLSEDVQWEIWGSLSLGASVQEAFAKAGLPNTACARLETGAANSDSESNPAVSSG